MLFKLGRLQARDPIVDNQGRPTSLFLRLFNLDVVQRIESQLQLIIQAQQTADAALAAAEEGAGARYTTLDAAAGAATATSTVNAISADSRLQLVGGLSGGTLDADAEWEGQAEFFENDISLGVVPITTQSTGLSIGSAWQAEDSSPFTFDVTGTQSGTVEYKVTVTRTGGSNYVAGATINSTLTITPRAM